MLVTGISNVAAFHPVSHGNEAFCTSDCMKYHEYFWFIGKNPEKAGRKLLVFTKWIWCFRVLYACLREEQANTTLTFPLQNKQKQSLQGLKKNLSSAPGWGYGEGQLLSGCSLSSSCPFTTFLSRQSLQISEERSRAGYWMACCQQRSSLSLLVNKATKLFSLSYHK